MVLRFLRDVGADIREGKNIDVYLTVPLCLVVVLLDVLGIVNLTIVTSAILAALALLAFNLLANRRTEQELQQWLRQAVQHNFQYRLSEIFVPFGEKVQERRQRLGQADHVWILSRTCRRVWADNEEELQTVSKRGGLKLLFLDPADGALGMVAKSAVWDQPGDGQRLKSEVEHFIQLLKLVQERLSLDKLEIRLIDYLPAWTLILIDPDKDDGVIYVELATFRSSSYKRPSFIVDSRTDHTLFEQFRDDFKEMWNRAQTV